MVLVICRHGHICRTDCQHKLPHQPEGCTTADPCKQMTDSFGNPIGAGPYNMYAKCRPVDNMYKKDQNIDICESLNT